MSRRTDDELLDDVNALWQRVDPPPHDLADGVLSRLAAEELDFDLMTLVEEDDLAGVRSVVAAAPTRDEVGTWSLEYSCPAFRVHLRITRTDGIARVDGWMVPAHRMTVRISTERPYRVLQQTQTDERGRFELLGSPTGLCRLIFLDESRSDEWPRATPPFWI